MDHGLWECPSVTSSWSSCRRARALGEIASCSEPELSVKWWTLVLETPKTKNRCSHVGIIIPVIWLKLLMIMMMMMMMMMMMIVKLYTYHLYEFDTVNQIWKTPGFPGSMSCKQWVCQSFVYLLRNLRNLGEGPLLLPTHNYVHCWLVKTCLQTDCLRKPTSTCTLTRHPRLRPATEGEARLGLFSSQVRSLKPPKFEGERPKKPRMNWMNFKLTNGRYKPSPNCSWWCLPLGLCIIMCFRVLGKVNS